MHLLWVSPMYRPQCKQKLLFTAPEIRGNISLDPNNRWVKMTDIIDWSHVEDEYQKNFQSNKGEEAYSARVAFGVLLIKEFYDYSDRETVQSIKENPYLQYFLGFSEYKYDLSLHPSQLTYFRKRFPADAVSRINKQFIQSEIEKQKDSKDQPPKDKLPPNSPPPAKQLNSTDNAESSSETSGSNFNRGTIILDATCCPADIQFPTDVRLVHEARLKSEAIIDHLQSGCAEKKPRNYRERANHEYKHYARNRHPSNKLRRSTLRRQLGYLGRNLKNIEEMRKTSKTPLSERQIAELETITKLYEQQMEMWQTKTRRCPNRIVSIHQPHVRPIIRGKAKAKVEFGAKISICMEEGYTEITKLSWDAYNESVELIPILEKYKEEHGYYPKRVLLDKIYRTAVNIAFCNEHGIHISGPKLGRPPKDEMEYQAQKLAEYKESGERNVVEGKFGEGKRRYGLNCIMTKLRKTSETQIQMIVFTMNVAKALRRALRLLFFVFFEIIFSLTCPKRLADA